MQSSIEPSRFLELLQADGARLVEVAGRGMDAPVPAVPEWKVEDVVVHLVHVYLHKIECMRRMAPPDRWPPDLPDTDPLQAFDLSLRMLYNELVDRGADAAAYTWFPPDQTVGFWYRRMAQETAVHRVDVEAAHKAVSGVDPELAADGIDEVLMVMLAGDWSEEPVDEAAGKVVDLLAGGRIWRITLDVTDVTCVEHAPGRALTDDADVSISGDSSDLLLWAWGRGSVDELTVNGDHEVMAALRRRLVLSTQ